MMLLAANAAPPITSTGTIVDGLLDGLMMTAQLTGTSLIIGLVVGLVLAVMRLSKIAWLRWPALIYVEVMRGLPLLVLLIFAYFGVQREIARFGFALSPFWTASVIFGVCHGAYIAEVFRAGIQAVPVGQTEAARALGLSHGQTMRHVVLPQAVRNILPALVNQSVTLLKDTSLAYVIAVAEITYRANSLVGATFRTFEIWGIVALLYLALTLGLSQLARELDRRQKRSPKSASAAPQAA